MKGRAKLRQRRRELARRWPVPGPNAPTRAFKRYVLRFVKPTRVVKVVSSPIVARTRRLTTRWELEYTPLDQTPWLVGGP